MLETLFRCREAGTAHAPRQEDFGIRLERQSSGRNEVGKRSSHFSDIESEAERAAEPVVVIPVDFSAGSLEAARVGVSVAQYTHAFILLCHAVFPKVIPFGPASPAWVTEALQSEATHKMAPFQKLAEQAGVKAKCLVEVGTPVGVILKTASRYGANLIVLTARDHNPWMRLLFGRTITEQVVHEAECHVMLVRMAHD